MVAGSYKTIAAVKSWFFENNLPYFSLYVGTTAAGTLVHSQTKTQDIQKAWEVLENNLRQMSEGTGGTFFILSRREKESDGTANLKDTQGPRCVASLSPNPDINMSPYAAMNTPPSVKGIAGIETAEDLETIIQKRVNAALVAEREKTQAKREIEELKDAIQGLQEVNPTVKHLTQQLSPVLGQLAQIGAVLLAQKFGVKMPDMAAMAGAHPPPQYDGEQNTDTEEEEELDYDSLDGAIDILRKQGVGNPEAFILKAANYAAKNPQMITMLQNY